MMTDDYFEDVSLSTPMVERICQTDPLLNRKIETLRSNFSTGIE